jgi:hypothetical protein
MTLNYELQQVVADEITHSASVAAQAWAQAGYEAEMAALQHKRPFMTLRPRIFLDGSQWCARYGENLQDGVAGFGETPAKAAESFDLAWLNEKAGIGLPEAANRSGVAGLDHARPLCADCTTESACRNRLDVPRPCWPASGVLVVPPTGDTPFPMNVYLRDAEELTAFIRKHTSGVALPRADQQKGGA